MGDDRVTLSRHDGVCDAESARALLLVVKLQGCSAVLITTPPGMALLHCHLDWFVDAY